MSETKKLNREHSFDYELAAIVGIEKAILLKNIDYWCKHNRRCGRDEYFVDGIWWTDESLSSLAEKYRYMARASIGRWMNELTDLGWIITRQGKWKNSYAVGEVLELWDSGGDWQTKLSQNETRLKCLKMGQKSSQNETTAIPKWDNSRPKMGRTPILDIESDIEGDFENNIPPQNGGHVLKETKRQKISREAAEAIIYLNEKCRRDFQATDSNLKFPRGRLESGATLDELKQVVDWAAKDWPGKNWGGRDASFYLRPETLFNATKFDSYRQQAQKYLQSQKEPEGGISSIRSTGIYSGQ